MAYKTPNKASEYLREIMGQEPNPMLLSIMQEADRLRIPILLPEAVAFTKQLVMLSCPQRVLEIGTAIGYSGCLFLANSPCHLTTIDKNADYLKKARENLDGLGFAGRYTILEGDSDDIVPTLTGSYDFIFLDGAKTRYVKYLPYIKRLLRVGGILLADNVFFNGMVTGENEVDPKKKNIVNSLDEFLKQLFSDSELVTSVVNVGDGMSLSIKQS